MLSVHVAACFRPLSTAAPSTGSLSGPSECVCVGGGGWVSVCGCVGVCVGVGVGGGGCGGCERMCVCM